MRSPRKPGLAKFIWFGMGQFMMNAYINAYDDGMHVQGRMLFLTYDWLKVSKRMIMFSCILGRGLVSKIFG